PANSKVLAAVTPQMTATDKQVSGYLQGIAPDLGTPIGLTPPGSSNANYATYESNLIFGKSSPQQTAQDYLTSLTTALQGKS
ncbi:MAG: hypothetical protein M0Z51_00115, partial [Propionibacterium sp.]|nr:hypothetical protein [Propionibacterium sp.]